MPHTLHAKHAAQVAAAALSCTPFEGMSGVSEGPVADSPYLRPVLGLISASTAFTTACETMGMLVKTVKISEPMDPDSWKQDCSTARYRGLGVNSCCKRRLHALDSSGQAHTAHELSVPRARLREAKQAHHHVQKGEEHRQQHVGYECHEQVEADAEQILKDSRT